MDILKLLTDNDISQYNICDKWHELHHICKEPPLISSLSTVQEIIEKRQSSILVNTPVLGASKWFVIEILYLDDDYYAIKLEDGHIQNCIIVRCVSNNLELIIESSPEV